MKLLTRLTLMFGLMLAVGLDGQPVVQAAEVKPSQAAHPYEVRGTDRRLLDRMQLFIDQQRWDDALDVATRLLETDSREVVAISDAHYVSLQEACHRRLARFPAEAIARYRSRVDAPAETWYRQAVAQRDQHLLQRVVDEMFCSSWGDDALLALGELALERGDYQMARNHWQRISPKLRSPVGQQISNWLAYPDTDLNLADVRARLALVSIREADWKRAEQEMASLHDLHPEAKGRLGGREVVYTQRLAELLAEAQINAAALTVPNKAQPSYEVLWSHPLANAKGDAMDPLVVGELLVYQDATGVHTLRLATGQAAFASKNSAFPSIPPPKEEASGLRQQPRYQLTASGQRVFGTTDAAQGPQHNTNKINTTSALWGIDLDREGALCFWREPDDTSTTFAGAPMVKNSSLLVAFGSNDQTARAGLACYDLASRTARWQRWICQANPPAAHSSRGQTVSLLADDSEILYFHAKLGAIAAIRAHDGHVLWIHTFAQAPVTSDHGLSLEEGPDPCVYHRGMLFVLLAENREILALDAATGFQVWKQSLSSSQGQMVGVAGDRLLVACAGLQVIEMHTGKILASNAEIQLVGRAVVVDQAVIWPSDKAIQWVDAATGKATAMRLSLPESGGANLLIAGEHLVAAGRSRITVFRRDRKINSRN